MALVVLGSEDLDSLQHTVEELFWDVENKNSEMPVWTQNPYSEAELQKRIEIVPVKDLRNLSLSFVFPDTTHEYKSSVSLYMEMIFVLPRKFLLNKGSSSPVFQSDRYLSHLIGHEGEGSLLSHLKGMNWVNHLEASGSAPGRGFGQFRISVDLTLEGIKNVYPIALNCFQVCHVFG